MARRKSGGSRKKTASTSKRRPKNGTSPGPRKKPKSCKK